MKTNDTICLPRSALGEELWRDKDLWQFFGYLLHRAGENGEWVVSLKEIHRDIGLARQPVRRMLKHLEATAWITTKATTKATTVTINISPNNDKRPTTKTTTKTTTKKSNIFIPPTDQEVKEYVTEKGYHFNPAEFVPFYQTRGWKMKGGEPMKDWKAGCRYWETNWKQKHGERFYYEMQQQCSSSRADIRADRSQQRTDVAFGAGEMLRAIGRKINGGES